MLLTDTMSEQPNHSRADEFPSPPVKVNFRPVDWNGPSKNAPSTTGGIRGFAIPSPGFDIKKARATFSQAHGKRISEICGGVEESIKDEIARKNAELAKARGQVIDMEKVRIADAVRALREGAWLEGLKPQLVNKDTVPIQYFNRLIAELEQTIAKVVQINSAVAGGGVRTEKELHDARKQIKEQEDALVKYRGEIKSILDKHQTLEDKHELRVADLGEMKKTLTALEERFRVINAELPEIKVANHGWRARCKELQQERDMYQAKWASKIFDRDTALTELQKTTENTDRQIKELYHGIDKLCAIMKLDDSVVTGTPQVLDEIAKKTALMMDNRLGYQPPRISGKDRDGLLQLLDIESAKWDRSLDFAINSCRAARSAQAAQTAQAAQGILNSQSSESSTAAQTSTDELFEAIRALEAILRDMQAPRAAKTSQSPSDEYYEAIRAFQADNMAKLKLLRDMQAPRAAKTSQSEGSSQLRAALNEERKLQHECNKQLLIQLSNAKDKLLGLAGKSIDGDEIGAIVEEFLQPAMDSLRY